MQQSKNTENIASNEKSMELQPQEESKLRKSYKQITKILSTTHKFNQRKRKRTNKQTTKTKSRVYCESEELSVKDFIRTSTSLIAIESIICALVMVCVVGCACI